VPTIYHKLFTETKGIPRMPFCVYGELTNGSNHNSIT
jgi:hypothetical protein